MTEGIPDDAPRAEHLAGRMSSMPVRFVPSPDTISTRVGDEIVLVNLKTDRVYALNRTGARVWELLVGGCDRADLAHRLPQEFDGTGADLTGQIEALLGSLAIEGLLVDAGP
jgi:hypothetical protein